MDRVLTIEELFDRCQKLTLMLTDKYKFVVLL